MVDAGKLPGITFSFSPISDDAAVYSSNWQAPCSLMKSFNIRRCVFMFATHPSPTKLSDRHMCLAFVEGSWRGKHSESGFTQFCIFLTDFLMIDSTSDVTMAPARHLNSMWQCCFCSIWTKKNKASVFMKANIITDRPLRALPHHKLFKTVMLRNYYAIIWMYYYHYYLRTRLWFL